MEDFHADKISICQRRLDSYYQLSMTLPMIRMYKLLLTRKIQYDNYE